MASLPPSSLDGFAAMADWYYVGQISAYFPTRYGPVSLIQVSVGKVRELDSSDCGSIRAMRDWATKDPLG
jgi:hypothetical protein